MKTPKNTSGAENENVPAGGGKAEAGTNAIRLPCVYCGPSIRGVARQYTTFTGRIPEALEEIIAAYPAARGLTVGTAGFARTRMALETPGTRENLLYTQLRAQLKSAGLL